MEKLFEKAVDAIVDGDITALKELLRLYPGLVTERSERDHHATLLHYTAANGVEDYRQKTPSNIVEITRLLLDAGADVNAVGDMYGGSSTVGLASTSIHPARAGVQEAMIDLLLQYVADPYKGVKAGYTKGNLINDCLANGRGQAAAYLRQKGLPVDLEGAAGTGDLASLQSWLNEDGSYMMQGILGQYVYVNPAKDLIMVRLGEDWGNADWDAIFGSLAQKYK